MVPIGPGAYKRAVRERKRASVLVVVAVVCAIAVLAIAADVAR